MFAYIYLLLLTTLYPSPRYQPQADRVEELVELAQDVASTDATEEEAVVLVNICVHESRCSARAVGDGGRSRGAWQVRAARGVVGTGAAAALAKVRWSRKICGDLSAYAGCGRCGSCPDVVRSLMDPKLPRR